MKKETARREIEALDYYLQNHTNDYSEESHMAMMMAIEALEQEPCEDAVSRQAVKEQMIYYGFLAPDMTVTEFVEDCLPSVNPKNPKCETAKWIRRSDIMSWKWFECDRCTTGNDFATPYCPHCGAQMVEPQESEEV